VPFCEGLPNHRDIAEPRFDMLVAGGEDERNTATLQKLGKFVDGIGTQPDIEQAAIDLGRIGEGKSRPQVAGGTDHVVSELIEKALEHQRYRCLILDDENASSGWRLLALHVSPPTRRRAAAWHRITLERSVVAGRQQLVHSHRPEQRPGIWM